MVRTWKELSKEEVGYIHGAVAAAEHLDKKLFNRDLADLVTGKYRTPHDLPSVSKDSVNRVRLGVCQPGVKRTGRPRKTTPEEDDKILEKLDALQDTEDGEVTATMLKHAVDFENDVSACTVGRRLREKGLWWKSVPRHLTLSDQDISERLEFAVEWKHKPKAYWQTKVCFMDNKVWAVKTTHKARTQALTQSVRGMYRARGKKGAPAPPAKTKPHKYKHRDGGGHKGIEVCAGFGNGQCLFAVVVSEDIRWSAAEYVRVVEGTLTKLPVGLTLVRDNDPKGYQSGKGMKAERDAGVVVLRLPKRSPNLQAMDYTFHMQIQKVLRGQEKGWPREKVETREEFAERVLLAYRSIPKAAIDKGCAQMKERLQSLYEHQGHSTAKN